MTIYRKLAKRHRVLVEITDMHGTETQKEVVQKIKAILYHKLILPPIMAYDKERQWMNLQVKSLERYQQGKKSAKRSSIKGLTNVPNIRYAWINGKRVKMQHVPRPK